LLLALAVPAHAQTTTTTATPTTSTTIVGARCARNLTLCRISFRLETLRETVGDAWTSQGLPLDFIVFRLQRSSNCFTRASGLCNGRLDTSEKRAREKLQQCVRPLAMVLARIRSDRGRRNVPADLAATIESEAYGLTN